MSYAELYFRPALGESVHTSVALGLEGSCAICARVTDSSGRPVPDTLALLFDEDDKLLYSALTDDKGIVAFGPLKAQLYRLRLSKDGLNLRSLEASYA